MPRAGPTFHFVGGKGGAGKTTCSAALGLAAAASGQRVLVVSTDPAPSLGDALDLDLSTRPRRVSASPRQLYAAELDPFAAFRRWIHRRQPLLESIAIQGTWLDHEDVARLIGLSLPGLDEIAALLEIAQLARSDRFDHVVVDTAPTGHTLRLLALPATLAGVASVFDAMREKGRLVEAALRGRWIEGAEDAVIRELTGTAAALHALLRDPGRTRISWVTLPEPLSVSETNDAISALAAADLRVQQCIVNRRTPEPPRPCAHCDARVVLERQALQRLAMAGATVHVTARDAEPRGLRALATIAAELNRRKAEPHGLRRVRTWRGSVDGASFDATEIIGPLVSLVMVAGKGGVGKTTCAAALALAAATRQPERRILLLSTDPAHSLADVFAGASPPEGGILSGVPNLEVKELDASRAYAALRARYSGAIDRVFDRLSSAGHVEAGHDHSVMKRLLDLAPPGLDELAAILDVSDTVAAGSPEQLIVMDTAPTGHALRLLEMPGMVHEWVRTLMAILLKYQGLLELGTLGATLLELSQQIGRLRRLIADPDRAHVVVVTRAAVLPRLETLRLLYRLTRLSVAAPCVVVNAVGRGTCGSCQQQAAREAREVAAIVTALRRRRRAPALLLAPTHLPPPSGTKGLMRWGQSWSRLETAARPVRYHRIR